MLSIHNNHRRSDRFSSVINQSNVNQINKDDFKKAAKAICAYYDQGRIEEAVFLKTIKQLMEASIIEGLSEKIESKTKKLDKKNNLFF